MFLGHKDLESLHRIYEKTKEFCKQQNLPFNFKVDDGSFETAIEFKETKPSHPPISKNWESKPNIFCPDLLDWEHKLIIEYEEEIGDRKPGAKSARKGHHREGDISNKRDAKRNHYYSYGNFHVLQIWESDSNWEEKLELLLIKEHVASSFR